MSQDYGVTTATPDANLSPFASGHPTMTYDDIVITSGQDLKRGTCLGKVTATGKYVIWDSTASDGSETLAGILVDDTDASDGEENASMYISGEFNASALFATYTIVNGYYDDANCAINIKGDY